MAPFTKYLSSHYTNVLADSCTFVPTVDHSGSALREAIQESDDKMTSLVEALAVERRRFDVSIGSYRLLEHQYRATLSVLKDHLQACVHSTYSDPNPLYLGEFDGILEAIRDQKGRLHHIKTRIRQKEFEFAQFSSANWKAVSSQHLQRDRTMLVFSVQQFELP